ncbi:type II toxin-antitoxin system HicA family toxin [Alishewanella sp. BS5-314]|uniref:type II toxin-antitoxin system HicA family toxin n=1 Tax=Alishewanella sp. BS5-314 TaxID=2755587 RepID=UPI0021BB2EC8|nr:type II toxin-antitoxin system HicA family toxin [Alishewanella sp. BS5-314]MCT8124560.1 type II toxin-antitoxin system HicA family toxin [Alishewanella sp. BS5-314]
MRSIDLIRELKAAGCELKRQGKGSHQLWYSPLTGKTFVVPHPKGALPIGTLKAIRKAAGI